MGKAARPDGWVGGLTYWWVAAHLATLLSKQEGSHYHAGSGLRPLSECLALSHSRREGYLAGEALGKVAGALSHDKRPRSTHILSV